MAAIVIDGNFTTPQLVAEKPSPATEDGLTLQWEETYVQRWANYVRAPIASRSARHPECVLVEERVEEMLPGGLVRFTRVFCGIPPSRIEKEQIAYTFPGKAGGFAETWDRYKNARPSTIPCVANVFISYLVSAFPGGITPDNPTVIKFDGEAVDFTGTVWDTTADPPTIEGVTSPSSSPGTFVVDSSVSRWRGPIWEKRTRRVTRPY